MSWRAAEADYEDDVIRMSTLPVLFEEAVERYQDEPAQQYKGGIYDRSLVPDAFPAAPDAAYATHTYGEMAHIVRRLAAGFRELGLQREDRVAIFSKTRMEWALTDFALLGAGGVITTLYDSASPEMVEYILNDTEAVGVVVGSTEQYEKIRACQDDTDVRFIVTMDDFGVHEDDSTVMTLGEVYATGQAAFDRQSYDAWLDAGDPDDLATIIYTSGTTGRPKGVQLTHANIRSNINQLRKRYGPRPDKPDSLPRVDEETLGMSFLPLAHIFERTAGHFFMFAVGATVAYAESPDTLRDDFQMVRPTVATSVPRVYEKIYRAIREQASESSIKEKIFHWAVEVGETYHRTEDPGVGLRLRRSIADRLVFQKVRDALGGNIEMLISGGGSLSPDLCALYHGMGLPIYEGYGLTETAPVATCNPVEDPQIGTIGPPLIDMEVRIDETIAVSEDLAIAGDEAEEGQRGELLLRGPNVSPGYWNRPDATAEAFVEGGWFRTGDIVRKQPDDYLVFIERAKEVFVLSTGRNVAPGPIEDKFAASQYVDQCMLVGDNRPFIGAIIVPNEEAIREWAAREDFSLPSTFEDVCADDRVRAFVNGEIAAVNEDLEAYEAIRAFELVPIEFTEENDLLTPTMKKKRRNILDRWDSQIEALYEKTDVERPSQEPTP